jgi:hypothetical protein
MRKARSLKDVKNDPRVKEVWSEYSDGGDDWWVQLVTGFNFEGCACLHEWTVGDLCDALGRVVKGEPY